jgi:hypothetical protein
MDDAYELDDPKHPTFYDRWADRADIERKREKEEGPTPPTQLRRRCEFRTRFMRDPCANWAEPGKQFCKFHQHVFPNYAQPGCLYCVDLIRYGDDQTIARYFIAAVDRDSAIRAAQSMGDSEEIPRDEYYCDVEIDKNYVGIATNNPI